MTISNFIETHSTPGVGLARVRTFLIFGTAERTPFARKTKLKLSRGKTLSSSPNIWQVAISVGLLAKSLLRQNCSLAGGSTGLFGGNRLSFTNKRPTGRHRSVRKVSSIQIFPVGSIQIFPGTRPVRFKFFLETENGEKKPNLI